MNIFEKIYQSNKWHVGSGEGSLTQFTKGYRDFLERFLRQHDIHSVLDFGCGDWQFSRYIDWGNCHYHGVDVVPSVIENNKKMYETANRHFSLVNTETPLEHADMLLVKDVLQHWSNERILAFLPRIRTCAYALITNCGDLPASRNTDIADGGFRSLDLTKPPFNLRGEYVFSFRTRPVSVKNMIKWFLPRQFRELDFHNKRVLLVERHKPSSHGIRQYREKEF